jgi:hypothetical protein
MDKSLWLACNDPQQMLEYLLGKASERKLRLFACACCRRIWPYLKDKQSRKIVEVSEEYADGRVPPRKLSAAWEKADDAFMDIHLAGGGDVNQAPAQAVTGLGTELEVKAAAEFAVETFGAVARGNVYERIWQTPGKDHDARWAEDDAVRHAAEAEEERVQVALLRDVFGDPFCPVSFAPAWCTPQALAIARRAYEERRWEDLPLLADALEEAGCTDETILSHLRGPGPHVRGCWVVDLVRSVD